MNAVVARLTVSGLVGRRRAAVLLLLPAVLIAVAVIFRLVGGSDPGTGVALLDGLALGTVVPLLCVIVGTGAIGPEIEDGSIVYLLAKPLRRGTIVLSKLAVAVAITWVLAVVPVAVVGSLLGTPSRVTAAYVCAAAVASLGYCAVFLLLAVLTRNAVVLGLLYALLWETTVAALVPGARSLSIRQWSLSVAEAVAGPGANDLGIVSDVSLTASVVLVLVVTAGSTWYATRRLRTLRLGGEE